MVSFDKLIGHKLLEAPLVPFIPLIAAGIGAGAAVYQTKKAGDANDKKSRADASAKRENMSLEESKAASRMDRMQGQSAEKAMYGDMASASEDAGIVDAASQEKRRMEMEKAMAAQQGEAEYASKFKPGQGGEGDDTVNDFLVPKVADDTGLIRSTEDTNPGGGLNTPLGFAV